MKVGVMVESFRAGLDGGLQAAAEVGADGVQIYATHGEMLPANLDSRSRAALRRRIADMGLEIAALCGDFGGHGFQIADENPKRIDDSQRVMDLALDLGTEVITTHIGVVPADASHPRYGVMARACEELGRYGESMGATFAIETGPEPAAVLRALLDDIGIPKGMGVNFDPANLVMVVNEDIPAAVDALGPYIVHTHAKDGVHLKPVDAEVLYGSFVEPVEGYHFADYIREVPLGEGGVPFEAYLAALGKIGFDGYLTIEREVGADPRKDIEQAVKFLRNLLAA
ncbi:MAG TPA: sugar phosphate isomerase/epimerase family protein [Phycisphaerae bacterium]|nr:sugar phosphate isomerase/epimerase family protein [Phycisphaerae bacterium]